MPENGQPTNWQPHDAKAALASFRKEFLSSPHHATLGLLTLGVGLICATPLGLIVGATAYAIGWIYMPDLPLFTNWIEKRRLAALRAAEQREIELFRAKRTAILDGLTPERQARYQELSAVCRSIEESGNAPLSDDDPRLRKLDELMWTFLRLLSFEQALRHYVAIETGERLPWLIEEAEARLATLKQEQEAKKSANDTDATQRLVDSQTELLDVLHRRQERAEQAQTNLALVETEQQRLEQQIKLIRADAVASKNAAALSARIDATVDHLERTNRWLAEMDEFKDLDSGLPTVTQRVGFEAPPAAPQPPPLPEPPPNEPATRQRQRTANQRMR